MVPVSTSHINACCCSIPFFVAAPTTTLDPNLAGGADITIEHRPGSEVTHFQGRQVAPHGIQVKFLCLSLSVSDSLPFVYAQQALQTAHIALQWRAIVKSCDDLLVLVDGFIDFAAACLVRGVTCPHPQGRRLLCASCCGPGC